MADEKKPAAAKKVRKKAAKKKEKKEAAVKGVRDIGIDVPVPENACQDPNCPFHGTLPVRGQMIDGTVVTDKMTNTVVVEKRHLRFIPKYERYEKKTSRYMAHSPPCLGIKAGAEVRIMECRPISKAVNFVVIGKR